jgi:phosphoglycerate dehydrogenase-like enzyme
MYEKSYEHIQGPLAALGLDLDVYTFDTAGKFSVRGKVVPRQQLDVDYCWLSTHLNADGFRDQAFDYLLECKRIGVLQTFNAGLDHPFYKRLSNTGTRICNSSAQGVAIAEYVLAQVLAILQPIELQRRLQAERRWQITPFRELSQTNWLIVGFGPIGQQLAKRLKAFDAKVSVVRRSVQPSPLVDAVAPMSDLPRMLRSADVVVLACALNDATRGLADDAFFRHVKPNALFVNIARGALVDDRALLAALDDGRLEAAVLDVFHQEPLPIESTLWTHPKVRLTSHTSFAGNGGRARWDRLFLDNIVRAAKGEPLINEVAKRDI